MKKGQGKTFGLLFGIILVAYGCAATYQAPAPANTSTSIKIDAKKVVLFQISKRVLTSEGFQITNADEPSGTISTAFRNHRLSPAEADCGRTMGIDYLKDNRTSTKVAYNIIVDEQFVTVRANVEGEYKPGAVDQNITLTCNSKGQLEQQLLQKIQAAIPKTD